MYVDTLGMLKCYIIKRIIRHVINWIRLYSERVLLGFLLPSCKLLMSSCLSKAKLMFMIDSLLSIMNHSQSQCNKFAASFAFSCEFEVHYLGMLHKIYFYFKIIDLQLPSSNSVMREWVRHEST